MGTTQTPIRSGRKVQTHCYRGHDYATFGRVRKDGSHECMECKRLNGRRHEALKKHGRRMEQLLREATSLTTFGLPAWQRRVVQFFEDVEASKKIA